WVNSIERMGHRKGHHATPPGENACAAQGAGIIVITAATSNYGRKLQRFATWGNGFCLKIGGCPGNLPIRLSEINSKKAPKGQLITELSWLGAVFCSAT